MPEQSEHVIDDIGEVDSPYRDVIIDVIGLFVQTFKYVNINVERPKIFFL